MYAFRAEWQLRHHLAIDGRDTRIAQALLLAVDDVPRTATSPSFARGPDCSFRQSH
jgi:hypothetical protein